MEMMVRMPQSRIAYAPNEIPLFHSIICRNLFAFKLFVWCRTNWKLTEMMDNVLHQMRYYSEGQFFADDNMPQILRDELLDMLNRRAKTAETGKETLPTGDTLVTFDLHLNEIAYTNNIILLYQGGRPAGVYATMDNPNFLRSVDADFCQRMHQWIQQIETCSFHTSNERHRTSLFDYLKQKVSAGLTP